ncbi:MAG: acyl-CoA dehydrogenase [Methylobacteriaceae bacterium]|nr:acyl-CoA dehydrogenase [Methylobacteriaceae bacterium]
MTYRAPVSDILFTMRHVAGLDRAVAEGIFGDLDADFVASILQEGGKLAAEVLAPANRPGDLEGARLNEGVVTTPSGWPQMYRRWTDGGWARVSGPAEFGGMGLPVLINAACLEMWNAANMSFALCPLLTIGAVEALAAHATEDLKRLYLSRLVSGEWTGTMNLTEPQAGSDLGALRTKAEAAGDGSYRLSGQKIFITYGEHDLTDNIVHLVLARLPGAPPGTRGISLFVVPKYLVGADGLLQGRNDVHCVSIEHKLGIHASPTCTMAYGDGGGAVGWLVGEENRGLNCMFTMMNNARLGVGLQGVGIAERAYQHALAYAHERRQGRAPGSANAEMIPIVRHPDVRRMLLTMKSLTQAARGICYLTAEAIDRSQRAGDEQARAAAGERAGLLTPVAKAFATDVANEVASLGVQVHGGMGFIEETGAAQHMRDARIAAIYEGTNGIQAIDLVQRKLSLSDGAAIEREIADMRAIAEDVRMTNVDTFGATASRLTAAVDALEQATIHMRRVLGAAPDDALAGATPYSRLFGVARGGATLAQAALASHRLAVSGDPDPAHPGRIATARFFAENIAVTAGGLAAMVTEGAASVREAEVALVGHN